MRRRVTFAALVFSLATTGMISRADDAMKRRAELRQRLEGIGKNPENRNAAARLRELGEVLFDTKLLDEPEFEISLNSREWQDRWRDDSHEAIERRHDSDRRALEVIRSIDRHALKLADRLNYDLLLWRLEVDVEGQRFQSELLAIRADDGPQDSVPETLAGMPTVSFAQIENILRRLERIPERIDQTIALLERGLERGVTLPRLLVEPIPKKVLSLVPEDAWKSKLLVSFTKLPEGVPVKDQERVRARAQMLYIDRVKPAFQRLASFLEVTYLPRSRTTIATRDLPEGEAWYAHEVRRHTTTRLTPDEIHELGQCEVTRIRKEMDDLIVKAKLGADFADVRNSLLNDPQFFFRKGEENALLTSYREIVDVRINPKLVELFGRLPRARCEVKEEPSSDENDVPAYYEAGPADGNGPGHFNVNTGNLKSHPKWQMEALVLHESVPGHHLQISLSREPKDELPRYRQFGEYTAYYEGWGLYAEGLGKKLGLYRDAKSEFGRLNLEIWRAIRLVVDTGIHYRRWTREEAIAYFDKNAVLDKKVIEKEVERYIATPGRDLAYKIGELKMIELRDYALKKLGPAFDIGAFHDQLLGDGQVPLDVLKSQTYAWVAQQKARPPERRP